MKISRTHHVVTKGKGRGKVKKNPVKLKRLLRRLPERETEYDRKTGREVWEVEWTDGTRSVTELHESQKRAVEGHSRILKYRKEKDGKLHLDIDGSGRFGLIFSNYKEMREAIAKEYSLKKHQT